MNYSDYKFTLDVQIHQAQVSVPVSLNDTARKLCIGLTDGRKPYTIADGCIASFVARKPDGTTIHNNCIIERNTIVYEFTPQTTNVEGIVNCEIRLQKGGVLLVSPQFLIVVDKQVVRDDEIVVSADEVATISAMIAAETARMEAETARMEAETARQTAETARDAAESRRVTNDKGNTQREVDRIIAEKERKKAENGYTDDYGVYHPGRVDAERDRAAAETSRGIAENHRVARENDRFEQEQIRLNSEATRSANEKARQANEQARQAADSDINKALDTIMSIQNTLIGGGSV